MNPVEVKVDHFLHRLFQACILACLWLPFAAPAQQRKPSPFVSPIIVLETEGIVEALSSGAAVWERALTNRVLHTGDRIRTRARSRAALRWSDASTVRLDQLTDLLVPPPPEPRRSPGFELLRGALYFFHRGPPTDARFRTPTASAAVRGTEFVIEARDDGQTVVITFDGAVELANEAGTVFLQSGQQGVALPGQVPTRTAVIDAVSVVQWCLYYPAVLHLDELELTAAEQQALSGSLAAYRSGDLLQALALYPDARHPGSPMERVYLASMVLVVGRVDQARTLLAPVAADATQPRATRLGESIRQLIDTVQGQPWTRADGPQSPTEWLAESYALQRLGNLPGALDAARQSVRMASSLGFGWARVAELEFSFGRSGRAFEALEQSLKWAPKNSQALALRGFLLGAQNKVRQAIDAFDEAIAVDGALANAWLGRGLCRIRRGDVDGGLEDLQMAATLEPRRSLLRSYLGKAYGDTGARNRAAKEIQLARYLDANDPTSWLYSALLLQRDNHLNEAVRDLEESQARNDNRSLYRSRLMLDQDEAVRQANLANIYRDVGMSDWSVREAGRAVNSDYANYSAHLFLADSYNSMRDPRLFNLRYETPATAEYLLANLLAPVGAGTLSPTISQQEYSRLLEKDGLGVVSTTEYLSNGDWIESGAQFGTFGRTSYSVEGFYRKENGQRYNDDLEQRVVALQLKQELTPADSLFARASFYEGSSGDVSQYYDPAYATTDLRFHEEQEPQLTLGYHHQWSPGVHTLLLGNWLKDSVTLTNSYDPTTLYFNPGRDLMAVHGIRMHEDFRGDLSVYSGEIQQIFQTHSHNTVAGGRFQYGDFNIDSRQVMPSRFGSIFADPPADQHEHSIVQRSTLYLYHYWQVVDSLQLIGGVTADWLTYPENVRTAPISGDEDHTEGVFPKAGLVWTPASNTTVRFAFTRSLAGADLDQSLQLEPTQIAGFVQSFRSIIPESVAGANSAARFETFGLGLEQKFGRGTYLGISAELLSSRVHRDLGAFGFNSTVGMMVNTNAEPSSIRQDLDYCERSLIVALDQLLGDKFSVGAHYRLTHASYQSDFPAVNSGDIQTGFTDEQDVESLLHQLSLQCHFNHPVGAFAQFQALWNRQSSEGYQPGLPGEEFWQLNVVAGWRFARRRVEVAVGILNLSNQDYRLNPLTLYAELPRERTLAIRLKLAF